MAHGTGSSQLSGFALEGKRRRSVLSMAPLIDFTFILLIFFMVVTQFDRFTPVDVSMRKSAARAAAPMARTPETERRILHLAIHEDGGFLLDGERIGDVETFAGVLAHHQAPEKDRAERKPLLLVEPREAVSVQLLIDALNALKAVPGFDVRIVTPGAAAARPAENTPSGRAVPALPPVPPPPFAAGPGAAAFPGGKP